MESKRQRDGQGQVTRIIQQLDSAAKDTAPTSPSRREEKALAIASEDSSFLVDFIVGTRTAIDMSKDQLDEFDEAFSIWIRSIKTLNQEYDNTKYETDEEVEKQKVEAKHDFSRIVTAGEEAEEDILLTDEEAEKQNKKREDLRNQFKPVCNTLSGIQAKLVAFQVGLKNMRADKYFERFGAKLDSKSLFCVYLDLTTTISFLTEKTPKSFLARWCDPHPAFGAIEILTKIKEGFDKFFPHLANQIESRLASDPTTPAAEFHTRRWGFNCGS